MNNSMKEAEDYINQIPLFGPHTEGRNKSGNENLEAVMALLGNPHLAHKAIHVAGTNGKGSTVQFLRAILTEEGYRVRTFTSPHLISITERIEGITEEEFVECYQIVRNACGGMPRSSLPVWVRSIKTSPIVTISMCISPC